MHKRVWIFQYKAQVEKLGDKASWYVGWYDLDGKRHAESCGPGAKGRNNAEKRKRRIQSELDTGIHQPASKVKWEQFRNEYKEKIVQNLAIRSRPEVLTALKHFERITKLVRVESITTQTIDAFIAARRQERGKNRGSTISPATVNKDLRHIKAALRIANEWGYLPRVPRIRMQREPEKLPRYVTPEHFATIYHDACPLAKFPRNPDQHYSAGEWWQAITVTAYMTGLRVSELLSIRRDDLDLESGKLITRWDDNKGKRDETLPVHPIVCEHLRKVVSFHPLVFRWCHGDANLWEEFGRIQRAAGVDLPCREKHEHTAACHVYGFHDLRRAFATINAPRMKPEALQRLMRHKNYQTTLRYVNLADQLQNAVLDMPVADVLSGSQNRCQSVQT